MKNFKRILAIVLSVILAVPAMAFTASAETTLADYWTVKGSNVVSMIDPSLTPYDNYVVIGANDDGSVSVSDLPVYFQGAYSNYAVSSASSVYGDELDGFEVTIDPVGFDIDDDSANEYATSYSFYYSNQNELYGDVYGTLPYVYQGFYNYPSAHAGEYTYGIGLHDFIDISWAPGYFSAAVDGNETAEYVTFTIISDGAYWTCDVMTLSNPVSLKDTISVTPFNYFSEDDGTDVIGACIKGGDDEEQYIYGTCADAFEDVAGMAAFKLTVGAYANGVNTNVTSFNITSVKDSADVATFTGAYCDVGTHVYTEWSEPSAVTCTEDSVKTRSCVNCPLVETEVVTAATGHSYGDWEGYGATCTDGGYLYRKCRVEGCDAKEEQYPEATGHDYSVLHWVTAPTADVAGEARISCANCGNIPENSQGKDDIISVDASLEAFWTTASSNAISNINPDWAAFDDMASFSANDDGSISVQDLTVTLNGSYAYEPVNVIATNFGDELDGFDVTIKPTVNVAGGDLDEDGSADYASSYSFFYTTVPSNYTSGAYCKGGVSPNIQGLYTSAPAAGEYTYGVVLNDYMVGPSWAPDIYADVAVEGNNAAEYVVFVIISDGDYWTADIIELETPIQFDSEIKVEPFNYYSEEDEDNVIGVCFNGDTEAEQWVTGTCGHAFLDVAGKGAFKLVIAASGDGVNQANASFDITSIQDSTDVVNFGGKGPSIVEPVIGVDCNKLVVSNAQYAKDIIIISGEGYTNYAEIKAARANADFYYRATYEKLDGTFTYSMNLDILKTYTVLVNTIDGGSYIGTITTGNAQADRAKVSTNANMRLKVESKSEIKVIRYAPVEGLTTVAALKAADGYRAITRSSFAKIDSSASLIGTEYTDETTGEVTGVEDTDSVCMYPGKAGTYSYVVEYTDGTKEFGEFVLSDAAWTGDKAPVISATGISNITQNRIIKVRWAPGVWTTDSEVKNAEGSRTWVKSQIPRDVDEEGKNLSTRSREFKAPLSGTYTFSFTWGNAANEAYVVTLTF